jgi:hypothetical protein
MNVQNTGKLARQEQWIIDADFVGRFEALQQSFDYARACCGLQPIPLPHVNKVLRPLYRDIYDSHSRHTVGKLYEHEIDKFKYSF